MPGCATRCTIFSGTNRDDVWVEIRDHFGPRIHDASTIATNGIYINDINEWTVWANNNGADPITDVEKFGKWLIWKCSVGTTNYGNLSTRIRDHVGVSCVPCPYSTDSDADRTRMWLDLEAADPIPTQNDHTNSYMKVAQRGSSWGWECTYSGCPHQVDNGYPYFHV